MKKMWKTATVVCAATAFLLAAGTFTSCSNGSSSTVLEISGDVLIKCYDENIPSDGFIEIPDGVTTIGDYAFDSCKNLKSVKIPDSVTTIGNNAFQGCTIRSVKIGSGVKSIMEMTFYNCDKLENVEIPDSVTSIGDGAFWSCDSLTSVSIGNGVKSIGDGAFESCESLTNVTIPGSVTSIGERAFNGCGSLTSVTFTNKAGWHCNNEKIDVTNPAENATNFRYGEWSDYSLYK